VDQALATTETQAEVYAHVHPLAQRPRHGTITGESVPLVASMPTQQLTIGSTTPSVVDVCSSITKALQQAGSSQPGMRNVCLGLGCLLGFAMLLMSNRSKVALRRWRMSVVSTWLGITRRRGAKPADARRLNEPGFNKAAGSKPRIDIPAEAFRAVGRTVLRDSSASSVSSPMSSSAYGSQPVSARSLSSASLDRAREVLLSSSAVSSSPSQPYSSLDSSNLQTSCEEEQQLSSVVELQNLRKSLSNENSGLLDDATQLALDASWVCYDEADACDLKAVADDSARLGKPPRVSDTSAAPTVDALERRDSDMSSGDRDRRISLGWLAVEDALAASVSELTESDF